jgi:SPP1 family phage portal protein
LSIFSGLFRNNAWAIEDIIQEYIKEFNDSDSRKWMITGDKYYQVENDILERKITRPVEGGEVEDKTKSNNKLAHGFAKNLIDDKVGYLLTREYSLKCDNTEYVEKVKDNLGRYFQYTLSNLGTDASKKGVAWLQVYIDEFGKFRTLIVPSEQCIPIWKDNNRTELEAMIKYYNHIVYEGKQKKTVTKVEYYTDTEVSYYVLEGNRLIPDIEVEEGGPISHFKRGEDSKSWGKVPFIAFKNNRLEYPDIRFIKTLVDNYDSSRSDVANFIEEVKNLIYILKGYGGENLSEFMRDLNYYRAIKIDDPQDGGVDTLNPTLDIEAAKSHFEQLKRDIQEFGQGVNKDLDKFGSAPSGIALKFLYSGLDLKCNHMEVEFKQAFEQLLYFVNVYLSETGQGTYSDQVVEIIFNRDIAVNEAEVIINASQSKGVISNKTIVANHPWVTDVEEELKELAKDKAAALKEQQEAFGMKFDKVDDPNANEE